MITRWETEDERTLRYMKIPPKQKLEWLYQINKFIDKVSSKQTKKIRKKLKES